MPCSNRKARLLLKEEKAKIIGYKPFTIQMIVPTGEAIQEVHLGIDTGAKYVGVAVTSGTKVLAKGEIIRVSNRNEKSTSVSFKSLNIRCHNNNWQYCIL